MNKKAILEGLLFVVGEDGLSVEQIGDVLEIDCDEVKELIMSLKSVYEENEHGIRIDFLGNKLKLTTKREHREYYQKLIENSDANSLSQTALEVLAIIAYNGPITRVEVDKIRGVSSSQMVRKLVAKGLIKESGRSSMPGRPIFYEVTSEFLDYFGLNTIDDLPKIEKIGQSIDLDANIDLYHSKYKEDK